METVQDIELLVADVVMAAGHPNGFTVAKLARVKNPDLKVVLMSGHEIEAQSLVQGERFLMTPFSPLVFEIEARFREAKSERY